MWPFRNSNVETDVELDVPHRVRYPETSCGTPAAVADSSFDAASVSSYVVLTPLTADIEQAWREVERTMRFKSAYRGSLSC